MSKSIKILNILLAIFTVLIVAAFICLFLFWCSFGNPCDVLFEENYTEWYTEDGFCGFTSTIDNCAAYGYVTVNGKKVRARFEITHKASVVITMRYSEDLNLPKTVGGITYYYKDEFGEYFYGEFTGNKEDNTFITEDFEICAVQYPSFEMYSRKVEPSTVDARDYVYCEWRSEDNSVKIGNSFLSEMDVYDGFILKDEEVPVCFKWCDGKRFEIYNRGEEATELTLLASGSYTNVATDLALTFEEDAAFGLQGQTVKLTGTLN